MWVREDQALVPDDGGRVADGPDAVDDVERPDDQKQRRDEGGSTGASHEISYELTTAVARVETDRARADITPIG